LTPELKYSCREGSVEMTSQTPSTTVSLPNVIINVDLLVSAGHFLDRLDSWRPLFDVAAMPIADPECGRRLRRSSTATSDCGCLCWPTYSHQLLRHRPQRRRRTKRNIWNLLPTCRGYGTCTSCARSTTPTFADNTSAAYLRTEFEHPEDQTLIRPPSGRQPSGVSGTKTNRSISRRPTAATPRPMLGWLR